MGQAKKRGPYAYRKVLAMVRNDDEAAKQILTNEKRAKDDAEALDFAQQIILFHQEQADPKHRVNYYNGKLTAS